jgi:diguanylate cyclase (GGDEF)-like protein
MEIKKESARKVLIIDDDDVIREKLQRILRASYQLTEASSGQEARELLGTEIFDCILLDNRLGDIDGIDFIHEIKNLLKQPCPIIMITNSGDDRLIIEAMRSGVYDYINKKELTLEHLSSVISAGLRWAELEVQLKDSQEKLKYLSMYDGLTGLPNRHLFFDRLDQSRLFAVRESSGFALLMMDLNMFKEVNDTLGHAMGDALLKMVGHRLQEVSRSTDTFARLGGDEFAGILCDVTTRESAMTVVNKIIEAIGSTFMIEGQAISIGVSIGVSFFPQDDIDAQALLAKADNAMYKAKMGSHGYEFFEEDGLKKSQMAPTTIAGHLGFALKNKEFTMLYQPIINLVDGTCCGVEALARWKSPTLGAISPSEFIRVAERSSVIIEMSYTLLEIALSQVREWCESGFMMPVSVNLSAKMFDAQNVVDNIELLLKKHNVPPQLLTIEITETALLKNPANASSVIQALSEKGIKIAIDDFGTGYTSFKYLRQFMFNELKIDQLFVTVLQENTRDASIVRSFISLSEGFNITLIAEGVEDIERLMLLKAMGCGRAQGYYFSPPMAGENLVQWLEEWEQKARFIFGDAQLMNQRHLFSSNGFAH